MRSDSRVHEGQRACCALAAVLTLAGVALIGTPATAEQELWSRRYDGPGNGDDAAYSIAVSADGATVFVTGRSTGSTGSLEYATLAYDADTGTRLWTSRYHGNADGNDVATALEVSPDGTKVFVTGTSNGSRGTDYATLAYSATTGDTLWTSRYHGRFGYDAATSIDVSPDGGTVYVTGWSDGSAGTEYATVAYDATAGTKLWVKRFEGPYDRGANVATAVIASPDSATVLVTGYSYRATNTGDFATVAYRSATGAKLWTRRYNGPGRYSEDDAYALAVSPDGTTAVVTGESWGPAYASDVVTVAYDIATGTRRWTRRYDAGSEGGGLGLSVTVGSSDAAYVTGYDPGSTEYGAVTFAYDVVTGSSLWRRVYDGPPGGGAVGRSLALSPDGTTLFVTGSSFSGTSNHFVTIAYDAISGARRWIRHYDAAIAQNTRDTALSIAVSPDGARVFVTGLSSGLAGDDDYATVAYPS